MIESAIITNVLHSFKDKIVSKKQLQKIFRDVLQDKYNQSLIHNLRRKKEIIYVFKGYYYIVSPEEKIGLYHAYSVNEMVYAVLNKSNISWYLGLDSALEKNYLIWQSVARPIIINDSISGEKTILNIPYEFHKMKKRFLTFGYIKKKTKNRITYYYSTPEKTLIDYYYFHEKPPSMLKQFNKNNNTRIYLKQYPKSFKKKVFYP